MSAAGTQASAVIRTTGLGKVYSPGSEAEVTALQGVDMDIARGDFVAIMGPSGSGKSTLMNLIGCLDTPTAGTYLCDGVDVSTLDAEQLAVLRRDKIGFVFQGFNLLPRMSASENVAMPLSYAQVPVAERGARALRALQAVGLGERAHHRPSELSGGQQQRVAIARALTQQAEVILADEPIASLDPESARKVMEILADINRRDGKTVVVTLHQVDYALRYCPRAVALKGGRIHYDGPSAALSDGLLNDLYGADLDASLLFSDRARAAETRPLQLVNG